MSTIISQYINEEMPSEDTGRKIATNIRHTLYASYKAGNITHAVLLGGETLASELIMIADGPANLAFMRAKLYAKWIAKMTEFEKSLPQITSIEEKKLETDYLGYLAEVGGTTVAKLEKEWEGAADFEIEVPNDLKWDGDF